MKVMVSQTTGTEIFLHRLQDRGRISEAKILANYDIVFTKCWQILKLDSNILKLGLEVPFASIVYNVKDVRQQNACHWVRGSVLCLGGIVAFTTKPWALCLALSA